jgi:DNA-binding NarL/FixJ family response regulator
MKPPYGILIIGELDPYFRERLRNFLLAAGYREVEAALTVREALAKLRGKSYRCVLIGVSRPRSVERRMASVVQRRQPEARLVFLISADDVAFFKNNSFAYVIKERAFSTLLELLA